jgi:hypothetical protein
MASQKRKRSIVLIILLVLTGFCVLALAASVISNQFIPQGSQPTDSLSQAQKALMTEAAHLRQELGGQVWPGWENADIPLITFNEANAFLTGVDQPSADGWLKLPQETPLGRRWMPMDNDTLLGAPYFFQPLPSSGKTPENFVVKVGDRWAASMVSKEYGNIELIREFRDQMPPLLRAVIPFNLAIRLFNSDWYISGVLHESFHAYQGQIAGQRLYESEEINLQQSAAYPYSDDRSQAAWQAELKALQNALRAKTDQQAASYAREFLNLRAQRRADLNLSADLVELERQREWLEGGAKYTELAIWQAAAANPQYQPINETSVLSDFKRYQQFNGRWNNEVDQLGRASNGEGETRFYYSGMAQGFLLDRLSPGWKQTYFQPDAWFETMLQAALQ